MADPFDRAMLALDQPQEADLSDPFDRALHTLAQEDQARATFQEAFNRNQGGISREIESGWEQVKGSTARTAGEMFDWQGARDYATQRSAEAAGLSANSGFTQSLEDVNGVGSALSWGAKQVLNTAAPIATLAVPGGVGAALGRGALGLAAGAAANWAQQTGSNLDAQIEEGKPVDILSAGAAGVAQTALDVTTGVGGRVLGKVGLGLRAAEQEAEVAATRAGRVWQGRPGAVVRTAAEEGVTEAAQQALEEAQRATGAENYDVIAGQKRIIEAGVAGAVAGGVFGGVLGDHTARPAPTPAPAPEVTPEVTPPLSTPAGPQPQLALPDYSRIPTDQLGQPKQIEDKRGYATTPDVVTPSSPMEDLFTGATRETFRPTDASRIKQAIRGEDPLTGFASKLATEVHDALNKQDPAAAAKAIAEASKILEGDNTQLNSDTAGVYQRTLERAAGVVDLYSRLTRDMAHPPVGERGLFQILPDHSVQPMANGDRIRMYLTDNKRGAHTKMEQNAFKRLMTDVKAVMGGTANLDDLVAARDVQRSKARNRRAEKSISRQIRVLTDLGAALNEANARAQQEAAAQPAPEAPVTPLTADMARAQERAVAQAVAPAQAQQAVEQQAMLAQQRTGVARNALFQEALTSPKYEGKRIAAFMASLKSHRDTVGDIAPTAEELAQLQQVVPAEQMIERPTKVEKPNRQQERAQARAAAVAPVKEAQTQLNTMLRDFTLRMDSLMKLPEFATMFGEQFDRLMTNVERIADSTNRSLEQRAADMKVVMQAVKQAEAVARTPKGAQVALPIKKEVQPAPAAAVAPAPAEAQGPSSQGELFSQEGQPTPQAEGKSPAQLQKRLELADTIPPKASAAVRRSVLARRPAIRRLLKHLANHTGYDKDYVNDIVALLSDPTTTQEQALSYVDNLMADPDARGTMKPSDTKPEPPATEEPRDESAVYQDVEAPATEDLGPREFMATPPPLPKGAFGKRAPGTSVRKQEVQRQVNELTRGMTNTPRIFVVDPANPSTDPVEQAAAAAYHADMEESLGRYFGVTTSLTDSNEPIVVIYATRDILENKMVPTTLFHELLGHYGLRDAYGTKLWDIISQIAKNSPGFAAKIEAKLEEPAYSQYRTEPSLGRQLAGEEVIVDMLQKRPDFIKLNGWQKFKFLLKSFANRMGMRWLNTFGKFTEADINGMLDFAAYRIREGSPKSSLAQEAYDYRLASYRKDARAKEDARLEQAYARRAARELAPGSRMAMPSALDAFKSADDLKQHLDDRGVNPLVSNRLVSIFDGIKTGNLGMMLGKTLIDYSRKLGLEHYVRVAEIQQEQRQLINSRNKEIDQLMIDALRLDPTRSALLGKTPEQAALNKYMMAATRHGKWGYQPTWLDKQVAIDPKAKQLSDEYKARNPEGWKIADQLLQYAHKDRVALQEAVNNYINGEADADLAKALTPSERASIENRRTRQLKLFDKSVPKFDGPYFPLGRFGRYSTVAKSAEYLEAEKAKDLNKLAELRADPSHYAVMFRDSLGDAKQLQGELAARPEFKGGSVYSALRTETFAQMGDSPLMQMQKLKQMVSSELEDGAVSRETSAQINSLLKDLYIRSLADNSARKYDRRRENIEGADENMLRAFSEKMRADANSLGFISTYPREMAITESLLNEVNKNQSDPRYTDRKRFLGEVLRRRALIQAKYDSPWNAFQDKMMAISSIYHLSTSARYYLMNATQPYLYTAPVIGARYGLTNAWGALGQTYRELSPQLKTLDFWKGEIDFGKLNLKPDEVQFLKEAQAHGKLDFGAQLDAGFWEGESGIGRGLREANHLFRTVSSQVEFINRTVAGLSAYRLARDAGRSDAMSYGRDVIDQTQFNYATENQPRYFNMLPKVMGQFRKYQIGQIALQARLLKNALDAARTKGLTSAEFKEATAAVAYMYGQIGVVAGAMGLPGAQLVGVLGSALFGDDNEPINGERWMREMFGEGMGKYALRGVPLAAGVDMGGVGLGSLYNPLPYFNYSSLDTREGVRDLAYQAGLGAFGGMVDNVARPVFGGDAQEAAYQAMPSGIRNLIKAYSLSTKGLERKNGDLLLSSEETNLWTNTLQALGFNNVLARDAQAKYYEQQQFEDYYKDRSSDMKRAWIGARKGNDQMLMRELEAEWRDVQEAKRRVGLKPTPISNLYRAELEQKKRQKEIDSPPAGFR